MSDDRPRSQEKTEQRSTHTEAVDVEEDDMGDAWAVAPTEACSFVAVAVFASKKDAEAFLSIMRARKTRARAYDDLAVLPARAHVLVANTYDVKAGRVALKGAAGG